MTGGKTPILGRDERERRFYGVIERIGVTADGGARRIQVKRHPEIMTLQIAAGQTPDDVILAQAGDEVSFTVSRKFGLLEISQFLNSSIRDPDEG